MKAAFQKMKVATEAGDATSGKQATAVPEPTPEEAALAAKQAGNDAFAKNNYEAALECYSAAIAIQEKSIFYSNRAACHLGKYTLHHCYTPVVIMFLLRWLCLQQWGATLNH
jgi:hypothetical protein